MWKCPQCETANKGEKCIICGESNPYFPKVDLKGERRDGGKSRFRTTVGEKGNIQIGKNLLDAVPNMFRPERKEISDRKAVQNFEKALHTYEDFTQKGTHEKTAEKFALSRTAPIAIFEDEPFEEFELITVEQKRKGMLKKWILGLVILLIVCIGFLELQRARANSAMTADDYDSAIEIFESISFYRGSEKGIKECKYQKALILLEEGDYVQAKVVFEALGDYKDAETYLLLTDEQQNEAEDVEILY